MTARAREIAQPSLNRTAASAELVSIDEDGTVTVRLQVKSSGCGSSAAASVKSTLEAAIQNAAPDAASIVVEETGAALTRSGFVSVAQLASGKSMAALAVAARSAERRLTCLPHFHPSRTSAFATLRQFARKRAPVERCEMCSRELSPGA